MTTPLSETHPPTPTEGKAESFMDWFHVNSRWVAVGAIVVVAALLVAWFVQRTALNATMNSDRQLMGAKQSLRTGNPALAETDLQKVMNQYASKPAGAEAGMLLASLKLEKGDYVGAATTLRELADKVDAHNAPAVRSLLGDALSQQDKLAEAAAEYVRAADLTDLTNEKEFYRTKAARAFQAAGKTSEAKGMWEGLSTSENQAVVLEAKVRLGELIYGG